MQLGRIFDIGMAIVAVGGITVLVTGTNTAAVITAFGNAFASSLKGAMGH
jgi:hypothetical protein